MKKAKYTYSSGNVLLLPKDGLASMLLLEFVRDYSQNLKGKGMTLNIKNAGDFNSADKDFFAIRMEPSTKETYANAVSYINNNLPIN